MEVSRYERRRQRLLKADDPCKAARCAWNDPDYGCTCSSLEMWYQCPLEPEPSPEDFITVAEAKERGLIP